MHYKSQLCLRKHTSKSTVGRGTVVGSGGGSSSSSKSGSGGPIPAAGWRSVHGRAGARTDRDLARRRQLLLLRSQRSCGGAGRASAPDSAVGPTPAASPAHGHALCQPCTLRHAHLAGMGRRCSLPRSRLYHCELWSLLPGAFEVTLPCPDEFVERGHLEMWLCC